MKPNKRWMLILLAVLMVLPYTGCQSGSGGGEEETGSNAKKGEIQLLEGYPEKLLPLYKSERITGVSFEVRRDISAETDDTYEWGYGKDIYTVDFLTTATIEEVMTYYKGLMTSIDPYYSGAEDFDATLDGHPVSVSLAELDEGLEVHLIIGQLPADYVSENPFFDSLPKGAAEVFKKQGFYSQGYSVDENYSGGIQESWVDTYTTTGTKEEFQSFYTERYGKKTGWGTSSYSNVLECTWKDGSLLMRTGFEDYPDDTDRIYLVIQKTL